MFSQFDNEDLEDYFLRLNAQLRNMPPEERAEVHQELRQHLDALAAAHEELGATSWEATRAALKQLGNPTTIGRSLYQEWQLLRDAERRPTLLGSGLASSLLFALYVAVLYLPIPTPLPEWAGGPLRLYVAPPLLTGCALGLLRPSSAVREAVNACLLCCGIALAVSLPALGWDLAHVGINLIYGIQNTAPGLGWLERLWGDTASAVQGVTLMLFGLLPAGLSASFFRSLRRRIFSLTQHLLD